CAEHERLRGRIPYGRNVSGDLHPMAKSQPTRHTKQTKAESQDLLGQAEVRPGHMEKINVGMYEQGMLEPRLTLELTPNMPDVISATLARLDQGDHYTLVYHVQNFGDVTCWVGVRATAAPADGY
ncbi:MAG: hypothetical protein ACREMK_14275, partial [Gemmatimonadota bacterium]